jgi:hypothetical protein
MRYSAVWAFVIVGIWTSIAYTGIDAACEFHRLKVRECPNIGSRLSKILHAHLGKII